MKARLGAWIAIVAILSTFLVAAPVLALEGNCTGDLQGIHTGMESTTSSSSQNRSGVRAQIDLSQSNFDICNNYRPGEIAGAMAYVSIEPKVFVRASQILQIGIVECVDPPPFTACEGENNPRFAWAFAGCGGTVQLPIWTDIGPADYGMHLYEIWLGSDDYWHLQIDGGGGGKSRSIHKNHVAISCWDAKNRKATWMGERWNVGDSIGSVGTGQATEFRQAEFGVFNQGFQSANFYGGATMNTCHYPTADDQCGTSGGDRLWMLTVN